MTAAGAAGSGAAAVCWRVAGADADLDDGTAEVAAACKVGTRYLGNCQK